ncbi:MAG: hypothetical protein M3512_14820 [Bacteroidota bacterium]|nr:hypothetical protein [Bacteroidota bacterium]
MAKNLSEDNNKEKKRKEKFKKDKKALKKSIKLQENKEKELEKREKKIKKKEKKLQKMEEDLFDLLNEKKDANSHMGDVGEINKSRILPDEFYDEKPILEAIKFKKKNLPELLDQSVNPSPKTKTSPPVKNTRRTRIIQQDEDKELSSSQKPEENHDEKQSLNFTVRKGFSILKTMNDKQQIQQFLKGDERKTIQDAGEKRINQLNK